MYFQKYAMKRKAETPIVISIVNDFNNKLINQTLITPVD